MSKSSIEQLAHSLVKSILKIKELHINVILNSIWLPITQDRSFFQVGKFFEEIFSEGVRQVFLNLKRLFELIDFNFSKLAFIEKNYFKWHMLTFDYQKIT